MSTTFGVYKGKDPIELEYDCLPNRFNSEGVDEFDIDECFIEVAYRGNNNGYNYWLNDLAPFLSDDTKIYPLDNSAQGIYTIGDFKKLLNEQEV